MKYYIVRYDTENSLNCMIVTEEDKEDFLYHYKNGNRPYQIKDINGNITITSDLKTLEVTELYRIKHIEIE